MAKQTAEAKADNLQERGSGATRGTFADSYVMDFERPIVELERRIAEMRTLLRTPGMKSMSVEIDRMEKKAEHMREEVYRSLSAWQKVQIARCSA